MDEDPEIEPLVQQAWSKKEPTHSKTPKVMHSSTTTVSGQQQAHIHQLALIMVAFLCCTGICHANQERILTSNDGRSTYFKLIEVQNGNIIADRKSDSKRFVIPLKSLSENDQKFLATWKPQADQGLLVSRRPLTRGSYPSAYQPRYSSGGGYTRRSSSGGSSSGGGGCRYIGSRTVTINPCR